MKIDDVITFFVEGKDVKPPHVVTREKAWAEQEKTLGRPLTKQEKRKTASQAISAATAKSAGEHDVATAMGSTHPSREGQPLSVFKAVDIELPSKEEPEPEVTYGDKGEVIDVKVVKPKAKITPLYDKPPVQSGEHEFISGENTGQAPRYQQTVDLPGVPQIKTKAPEGQDRIRGIHLTPSQSRTLDRRMAGVQADKGVAAAPGFNTGHHYGSPTQVSAQEISLGGRIRGALDKTAIGNPRVRKGKGRKTSAERVKTKATLGLARVKARETAALERRRNATAAAPTPKPEALKALINNLLEKVKPTFTGWAPNQAGRGPFVVDKTTKARGHSTSPIMLGVGAGQLGGGETLTGQRVNLPPSKRATPNATIPTGWRSRASLPDGLSGGSSRGAPAGVSTRDVNAEVAAYLKREQDLGHTAPEPSPATPEQTRLTAAKKALDKALSVAGARSRHAQTPLGSHLTLTAPSTAPVPAPTPPARRQLPPAAGVSFAGDPDKEALAGRRFQAGLKIPRHRPAHADPANARTDVVIRGDEKNVLADLTALGKSLMPSKARPEFDPNAVATVPVKDAKGKDADVQMGTARAASQTAIDKMNAQIAKRVADKAAAKANKDKPEDFTHINNIMEIVRKKVYEMVPIREANPRHLGGIKVAKIDPNRAAPGAGQPATVTAKDRAKQVLGVKPDEKATPAPKFNDLFKEENMDKKQVNDFVEAIFREAFTSGPDNITKGNSNDAPGETSRQMLPGDWFGSLAWAFQMPKPANSFEKQGEMIDQHSKAGLGEMVGQVMESILDEDLAAYSDPDSVGYLINTLFEAGYKEEAAFLANTADNPTLEAVDKVNEIAAKLEEVKEDTFLVGQVKGFADLIKQTLTEEADNEVADNADTAETPPPSGGAQEDEETGTATPQNA